MSSRHTIARLSIASILAILGLSFSMTTFGQESSDSSTSSASSASSTESSVTSGVTEYTPAASSSSAPTGFGIIVIEQKNGSDVGSIGTWTLLGPNHSSGSAKFATQTLSNMPAGNYTLIATPPSGVVTSIRTYHGKDQITFVQRPQVNFTLANGEELKISINYTLARVGTLSIQSDPQGLGFTVVGPDGWSEKGTTPMFIESVPIGQYSIQFETLDGCNLPAPKSQQLKEGSRITFAITLSCKAADKLRAREQSKGNDYVIVNVDGQDVQLRDVPRNAWFSTYVSEVARRNVLNGYKDEAGNPSGDFGPGNAVTVAELAKIAHRLSGVGEGGFATINPENSAALGQWFSPFIASAESRGWTLYKDATVDPLRPVTRAEVLVTFLQVMDIPLEWQKGDLFKDVTVRTRYANAIETAAHDGIVEGLKDEKGASLDMFNPEGSINRAELAKIISNIFEIYKGGKSAAGASSSRRR